MYSTKQMIFILILLQNFILHSLSNTEGTVSSEYGRIANIINDDIYVSAASSLTDCIRQCVDFTKNHIEYIYDDCFAYNYDIDKNTCELIHSIQPLNYIVSFQTRWVTGLKS